MRPLRTTWILLLGTLIGGGFYFLLIDTASLPEVSQLAFGLLVGDGFDHLISTHSDMPVDAPHWQHDLMSPERSIPGKRMLIVGVHQRSVDVEHRNRHARGSTQGASLKTHAHRPSAWERTVRGSM